MSITKKILIFTATYNESENIEKLVKSIKTLEPELDLLIIDDNSPDNTADKIINLQKIFKKLFLIKRNGKLGLDSAHKEGYQYALKNNYDYLITMDADFSHDPNEIKNFIKNLEEFPFVIGSRYMKEGKNLMKKKRLFLSKYGNLLIKFFLKINCSEYTTSYRGFNLKKLTNFNLNLVKTKGYSFFMGTIFEINKKKFEIKEIPITFKDRSHGYSKIPKLEIFRTLKNLIILFLEK
jgi:dolichol-phosphate mannosyltransferase